MTTKEPQTYPDGWWRIKSITSPDGYLPISKSTWWAGVKSQRYPQPIKLGPRITVWKISSVMALAEATGCEASK
jgi:prophage regulatory protein